MTVSLLKRLILFCLYILRFVVIFSVCIYAFAYLEYETKGLGYLVGIYFMLSLERDDRHKGLLLLLSEILCFYFVDRHISYLIFSVLVIYCTFDLGDILNDEEVTVDFKPYESEVRKFLMRNDPSILHLVDDMLLKYNGDGDALMKDLIEQYRLKEDYERKAYLRNVVQQGYS